MLTIMFHVKHKKSSKFYLQKNNVSRETLNSLLYKKVYLKQKLVKLFMNSKKYNQSTYVSRETYKILLSFLNILKIKNNVSRETLFL